MHEQIIQAVQRKVHSICLQKHYTSIVIIRIKRKRVSKYVATKKQWKRNIALPRGQHYTHSRRNP